MFRVLSSLLFSVGLLSSAPTLLGQPEAAPAPARQSPALLAELNRDIWTPFSEAYADGAHEPFIALHAPDFIRVEGSRKNIRTLAEYSTVVRRTFEGWADREEKAGISFRFFERIVRGNVASERGIYELTIADNDGNVERFYGRFHVIARKVDDRWRLVVDYDSDEEGTIDRTTFLAAAAEDDFKRF